MNKKNFYEKHLKKLNLKLLLNTKDSVINKYVLTIIKVFHEYPIYEKNYYVILHILY